MIIYVDRVLLFQIGVVYVSRMGCWLVTYLYIVGQLGNYGIFCGIFWGKLGDGSKGEELSVLLKALSALKRTGLLEPGCKAQEAHLKKKKKKKKSIN